MKLAITSQGKDLDAALDPRFGRCQYFIIIDTDTDEYIAAANDSLSAAGGAGIQSAQFLVNQGVDAVVTGRVGPNATRTLQAGGIKVYAATGGTVRDALGKYKAGELEAADETAAASNLESSGTPPELGKSKPGTETVIAIATDGSQVAVHFGRCPEYTLVRTADGRVTERGVIPNPGHEPGFLPRYLHDRGVSCVIAGGMGSKAQQLFAEHQIETVTGINTSVDTAIDLYLSGRLKSRTSLCDHA
ncbi:MAG: NifB/NifX family molybdenum-iron cluster-binding protein [Limnochordia bacterium]|jgi:predicted Fe-Mo cluster-binding NifX family protein